jgi:hypothetical protein
MKCPACGMEVEASWSYCKSCGANLNSVTRVVGPEEYFGGLYHGNIKAWFEGKSVGHPAIHATDRRLIAVLDLVPKKTMIKRLVFDSVGIDDILHVAPGTVAGEGRYCRVYNPPQSKEQGAQIIKELESRKVRFQVLRDDIQKIELKKPGFPLPGWVNIITNSGKDVKIRLPDKGAHNEIEKLMSRFSDRISYKK